jgi:hypothetical protein
VINVKQTMLKKALASLVVVHPTIMQLMNSFVIAVLIAAINVHLTKPLNII